MKQYKSIKDRIILFSKGLAMGAADIVPGVSGGTIALIAGIYDHLIAAIAAVKPKHAVDFVKLIFLGFSKTHRTSALQSLGSIPFSFLLPLLSGIAIAILGMSRIIPWLMENHGYETFSVFFGLILFSVSVPLRHMHIRLPEVLLLIFSAVSVYLLMSISPLAKATIVLQMPGGQEAKAVADDQGRMRAVTPANEFGGVGMLFHSSGDSLGNFKWLVNKENSQINISEMHLDGYVIRGASKNTVSMENGQRVIRLVIAKETLPNLMYTFLAAAIAICAMVLPGISGAYILVILGQYQIVLNAIHQRDLLTLGVAGAGILLGLLSFIRILKWVLVKHHSMTMAVLTGLMIGSLRRIWPVEHLSQPLDLQTALVGIALAIGGAALILILERLSIQFGDPEPPK
ncbi:MAG: DUF368 domain-containing protein [Leptospiraceae bacterium]|nr:DUF368 domain-containing protein [Leptospiraceae bacterium]